MPVEQKQAPNVPSLSFVEFVSLMALLISLVALAIDAMLPALALIGKDLGVENINNNQLVISTLFLGVGLGQLLFGPLSDSTGRKPAIYIGLLLFILGCLLSAVASTFAIMLIGRLLQGIGLAGPRIVTVALIRDIYKGREMARVMSFVMSVFILVPTIAPMAGQGILMIAEWRAIFIAFLVLAIITFVWLAMRQQETLSPQHRVPISLSKIRDNLRLIIRNPLACGYTLVLGLLFGAFLGFINSAQPILQVQYGLEDKFPFYFAFLALSVGGASFINGKLVVRLGMRYSSMTALKSLLVFSSLYIVYVYSEAGHPPLWTLMTYLIFTLFPIGLLFSNLNALAMESLGRIAGLGAAVVGSLSTLLSVPLGILIGHSYNNTVVPIILGFLACGLAAIIVMYKLNRQDLTQYQQATN